MRGGGFGVPGRNGEDFPQGKWAGRRTAASGVSAPAGGLVQRDAPPIFFLRHQKENPPEGPLLPLRGNSPSAPRPVEKKKCSAGRSAQAQTSCRRRGKAGTPLQKSGTETPGPWGNLWPGEVGDTFSLPLRCRSRFREEQPAAAKRDAEAIRQPPRRPPHHPPRDGSSKNRRRPKRARRSAQIGAGTDPPTPVRTEGHCTGVRQTLFSLDRARPVSLLARQKRNGGCIPLDKPPAGAESPEAAVRRPISCHPRWSLRPTR